MLERFTEGAREAVVLAQEESSRLGHDWLGTEHLLLGLLRQDGGAAVRALSRLGVDLEEARERAEGYVGHGEGFRGRPHPFTPRAKRVLELAFREALELGHRQIGPAHVLLGLVGEPDGIAARVLADAGADAGTVRRAVLREPGVPPAPPT